MWFPIPMASLSSPLGVGLPGHSSVYDPSSRSVGFAPVNGVKGSSRTGLAVMFRSLIDRFGRTRSQLLHERYPLDPAPSPQALLSLYMLDGNRLTNPKTWRLGDFFCRAGHDPAEAFSNGILHGYAMAKVQARTMPGVAVASNCSMVIDSCPEANIQGLFPGMQAREQPSGSYQAHGERLAFSDIADTKRLVVAADMIVGDIVAAVGIVVDGPVAVGLNYAMIVFVLAAAPPDTTHRLSIEPDPA